MPTAVEFLNYYNIKPPRLQQVPNLCIDSTIGGIKKVYVSQRNTHGPFWYYTETKYIQFGEINGNSVVDKWYKLFNRTSGSTFTQVQNSSPSRSYSLTLTLSFNKMEIVKRDVFEQFVVARDTIFIVQDFNQNWWLLGETNGCIVEWEAGTDDYLGINGDKLTISCRERSPIRQVSQTFIDMWVEPTTNNSMCALTPSQMCALTPSQFCALTP